MTQNPALRCQRLWRYRGDHPLTKWYGHVQIAAPDVIGQWVRLDLETGQRHWHHELGRPNVLIGMTDTMLIASEMRSDGPWTLTFGVYGIDRATGELRWTSHREGWMGRLCRLLDRVPGFTNEIRDAPERVVDEYCICQSGRVLSARTGALLDVAAPDVPEAPVSDAWQLYHEHHLALPDGRLWVNHDRADFRIGLEVDGQTRWQLSVADQGRYIDSNYFSWRLVGAYVLLLVSKQPQVPAQGHGFTLQQADFILWFVSIATGAIEHREHVGTGVMRCRIEDATSSHILISDAGHHLQCYRWGVA